MYMAIQVHNKEKKTVKETILYCGDHTKDLVATTITHPRPGEFTDDDILYTFRI